MQEPLTLQGRTHLLSSRHPHPVSTRLYRQVHQMPQEEGQRLWPMQRARGQRTVFCPTGSDTITLSERIVKDQVKSCKHTKVDASRITPNKFLLFAKLTASLTLRHLTSDSSSRGAGISRLVRMPPCPCPSVIWYGPPMSSPSEVLIDVEVGNEEVREMPQ